MKSEEIEYKLLQALAIFKLQGGPKSIKVNDAVQIFQKNYPGITEYDIESIVNFSKLLDLQNGEIILIKDLTDLM